MLVKANSFTKCVLSACSYNLGARMKTASIWHSESPRVGAELYSIGAIEAKNTRRMSRARVQNTINDRLSKCNSIRRIYFYARTRVCVLLSCRSLSFFWFIRFPRWVGGYHAENNAHDTGQYHRVRKQTLLFPVFRISIFARKARKRAQRAPDLFPSRKEIEKRYGGATGRSARLRSYIRRYRKCMVGEACQPRLPYGNKSKSS